MSDIDALIAQHVMGWEPLRVGYYATTDETPRQVELADWIEMVGIVSVGDYLIDVAGNCWIKQWDCSPSTDIAQAFQVLEQFKLPEWEVEVGTDRSHGKWYCVIDGPTRNSAKADTAPMVICLAALQTKGVEVPSV